MGRKAIYTAASGRNNNQRVFIGVLPSRLKQRCLYLVSELRHAYRHSNRSQSDTAFMKRLETIHHAISDDRTYLTEKQYDTLMTALYKQPEYETFPKYVSSINQTKTIFKNLGS
jgi:hypothetical protein